VNLVLKSFGIRVQAPGTVRVIYPFLGMGISFAEIEPEHLVQLKQLLAALAGHSAVPNVESPEENRMVENGMKDTLTPADSRALLDEIKVFFQKNLMLSRQEFNQIAKRLRRS
jgi:hypothetical protein